MSDRAEKVGWLVFWLASATATVVWGQAITKFVFLPIELGFAAYRGWQVWEGR